MLALRLLTVVSASLLLVAKVYGGDEQQPPAQETTKKTTYAVTLGKDGTCLSEINSARKKAGFNDFVIPQEDAKQKRLPEQGEEVPDSDATWVWKPVCDVLIPQEVTGKSTEEEAGKKFVSGTYAFQVVVDAVSPSCTDVVEKWKNAYKNFNGLPPSNKNSELYTSQDNISFVAMYNPSDDATADCRVVTCTRKITTTPTRLLLDSAEEEEEDETKAEETKQGSALICMTTPDVLPANSEHPPFTEVPQHSLALQQRCERAILRRSD
ncbi:LOW QUALITY PROTEIN: SAG family member [Eimeria mitis]|uniref:SAG family member n=1 Tax=Eimeria mitis TaxID=44415 RepID=U6JTK2_9EIME|nr:LOW QUALITY PROTEIN: SAG family member [Eimeria mitis]CDJ27367.1 SAG family member [Eimeria mitis]